MLLEIRAFNEAARGLALEAALDSDVAHRTHDAAARQAAGRSPRPADAVLKGVFTDLGFENTVKAQQVFGGHGYIGEWGMEQFVRDARITMMYEGANGIQALDLVGRKLPKDGGRAIMAYFKEVGEFIAAGSADDALKPYVQPLQGALGDLQKATDVADAEWPRQARQRRRGVIRLYAPLWPGRAGICLGENRQGGAGEKEPRAASAKAMETKLIVGQVSSWSACCRKPACASPGS